MNADTLKSIADEAYELCAGALSNYDPAHPNNASHILEYFVPNMIDARLMTAGSYLLERGHGVSNDPSKAYLLRCHNDYSIMKTLRDRRRSVFKLLDMRLKDTWPVAYATACMLHAS